MFTAILMPKNQDYTIKNEQAKKNNYKVDIPTKLSLVLFWMVSFLHDYIHKEVENFSIDLKRARLQYM